MNSLNYLSRQFDALASAKTPPSTPTDEHESYKFTRSRRATGSESTKALASSPKPRTKRSVSSPADLIALTSLQRPQPPSTASAAASVSLEPPPGPVVTQLEAILHRTFIVRVLVLAWNTLRAAWASVSGQALLRLGKRREASAVEAAIEKDSSDDEISDEHSTSTSPPPSPSSSNRPPYMSTAHPPSFPYDSPSESSSIPSRSLSASATPPPLQGSDSVSTTVSRSSTPIANATRKTPFHLPKTLVLDLDETLIHSTSRPLLSGNSSTGFFGLGAFNRNKGSGHMVEVVLGGHSTLYHVYKRPFVDFFLRTVSGWYTLVIFTASMQEYADPIIDWLDAGRGILAHRLFRDSCTQLPNGSYTKDLSVVDLDLSRVCLIDNSPISYRVNEANGIPIEGWTHDPSDEALLDLLPVLDSLRFTSDVRRVLGLRTAGGISS
ncbi:FCP1-like proteiny domain-containing protein [Mycena venus]|uniref:FCP1-like proteiny domain-containing protein n=1 Tax=Mycena venus TaxID=2733690 RepID=A0A8H6Y6N3_9AGAR|nr:FCP1-like proteiny domain-containing protein [Mycena venus]